MKLTTNVTCPKCNGTGHLAHFRHVSGGNCFACKATGFRAVTIDACNTQEMVRCTNDTDIKVIDDIFEMFLAKVAEPLCPAA